MVATVYISSQCSNCTRFIEQLQWLQSTDLKISVKVINIDDHPVQNLTAVPTVVDGREVHVGTQAFQWLQSFDDKVPLTAYAFSNDGSDSELPSTLF